MDAAWLGRLFEVSVVSGAFVYMLIYITGRLTVKLDKFGDALSQVATILVGIETRMEAFERRLDRLESKQ